MKPIDLFTPTFSAGDLAALGVQVENPQVLVPRQGQRVDFSEMMKLNQVNVEHNWDQMLSSLHLEGRSLFHVNLPQELL